MGIHFEWQQLPFLFLLLVHGARITKPYRTRNRFKRTHNEHLRIQKIIRTAAVIVSLIWLIGFSWRKWRPIGQIPMFSESRPNDLHIDSMIFPDKTHLIWTYTQKHKFFIRKQKLKKILKIVVHIESYVCFRFLTSDSCRSSLSPALVSSLSVAQHHRHCSHSDCLRCALFSIFKYGFHYNKMWVNYVYI